MKQKRMYENQKEQLDNQSFNMEQSNFAIQGMKDNQASILRFWSYPFCFTHPPASPCSRSPSPP